jgi:hypothetical protein
MPRPANQNNLQNLKQAIERHPGERLSFFARLLGWSCEEINRGLTSLNDEGVLLYEDERGGLYPPGSAQT